MKKFEFSLEKVLELKNQVLDREKNTLGTLRGERRSLEETRAGLQEQFQAMNQKMAQVARKGTTALELRSMRFQMDGLKREMEELDERLLVLDKQIEAQLALVLGLTQEVSALDKLKEYQREEYDKGVAKAAETEIAEFVSGKLLRQRQA